MGPMKEDLGRLLLSKTNTKIRHISTWSSQLRVNVSYSPLCRELSAPQVTLAATTTVKMGADSGLLVFEPAKVTVCKGDTVQWINNKAGPHNVVFDEDNIPSGVDQEKISMDDQLGEPGDTFEMKFDTPGTYGYYCEPHRGAGMQATLIVQ